MNYFIVINNEELKEIIKITSEDDTYDPVFIRLVPCMYELDEWPLPRRSRYVHIDGKGAILQFKKDGFHRRPKNQGEALNHMVHGRVVIENFTRVIGGAHGLDLGATFNSIVRNVEFVGQESCAIALRFALMTRLENVLITNPVLDGVRVTTGNWPKAGPMNSQSNHTVLDQVRVYSGRFTQSSGVSFAITQCNGVQLLNCIAEGWPNRSAVVFDAGGNGTVKHFRVQNFHLEYAPEFAGFEINGNAASSVVLDQIYFSSTGMKTAIYMKQNGPLQLSNIGWWDDKWKIECKGRAPRVFIDKCHYRLGLKSFTTPDTRGVYPHNIHRINPLPA